MRKEYRKISIFQSLTIIMYIFSFLLLVPLVLCSTNTYYVPENKRTTPVKTIELGVGNVLLLRGEINDKLATEFVYSVNSRENKTDLYVYLDTNGGSVDAGLQIMDEIEKYEMSCIAHKAMSMGFVILQTCKERLVTPYSTIMQHQISYGIGNEKAKVESYVDYIKQIGRHLSKMQAKRIGISSKEFLRRTYNDWWLYGQQAIKENCADAISKVTCSPTLTNQTYVVEKMASHYVYSKCPLIIGPIEIRKKKMIEDIFALL